MPLLHCPKCCPKRWETVQGVAGSCSHSWEPSGYRETGEVERIEYAPGKFVETPKLEAIEPWGWKCDNCGHFKRPRPGAQKPRPERTKAAKNARFAAAILQSLTTTERT